MIDFLLNADPTPWFDARMGNLIGGLAGAGIGIFGGTLGAAAGMMAPKGQGRGLILGGMLVLSILGACVFLTGIVAVSIGQPYHVWYPFTMLGALLGGLFGGLRPVIRKRYEQAEARRMDADTLRRS
ncbi:MAG: hypothetical protein QM477_02590 [Planctomycetota bacterium]